MELYTMRYVLAVAELGSFSLASQACHVGQPALSQQVARLEKELGLALFTRSSRGVAAGPARSSSGPTPSRRRWPCTPGCAGAR